MHSLAEMKYRLGELSGLRVPIEFNVTIKANPKGLKPIKVEDRLRYLCLLYTSQAQRHGAS